MIDRSQFMRDHAVCWEMSPLRERQGAGVRRVGLELTLHARAPRVDPSSTNAREMHAMLRDIASEVLPESVDLAVEPYHAELHLRHATGWTPEVDLRALIRTGGEPPAQSADAQSADAQRDQARAIAATLRKLGIPEGVYREVA